MFKLSNGWTDWHQIWHTCADSSGNGYTLNKLPFETQGGTWGFYGVKHWKVLRSSQAAGPIGTNFGSRLRVHMGMDKYKSPHNIQGGIWGGGVRGSQIQMSGEAVKLLDRLAANLVHCLRIRLGMEISKYNSSLNTTVGISVFFKGVTNLSLGKLPNGWTDWHQFGTRMWIHLGMDIG